MYWASFLHIYQPPTQKSHWVKKITDEAYRKIINGLLKKPQIKITFNISTVLLELLEKNGCQDVIEGVRKLLARKQIELTGSAKYHPLLPVLPEEEIVRQINLSRETGKKYFGELYQPKGFFPPEMGFDKRIAEIVQKQGFEWIIVDELSFAKERGGIDYSKIYKIKGLKGFKIYFRERAMSYKILSGQLGTGNLLIQSLGNRLKKNEYLLTAMDGETFGHHRPGMEQLLFEICDAKELETILISDLPNHFKEVVTVDPLPSTWALMEKDLEKNVPFARWNDPENEIHRLQWRLTDLAINTVKKANPKDPAFQNARELLDRALHSDQYWWASAKPWWSLEMIEAGAKDLKDVVIKTPGVSSEVKNRAENLYQKIVFTGFKWQRSGKVEALARQEDEEVRQRTDTAIPKLPKKEIDKIVANLNKEMEAMANAREYERAAQLRDRIEEIKSYQSKEE